MKKILFYLEPVVFRNSPLFLLPHIHWFGDVCSSLSLGESDKVFMLSSAPLCNKALKMLKEKTNGAFIEFTNICAIRALDAFHGSRQAYAQDLYKPTRAPVVNSYLNERITDAFIHHDPDLVVASAENRYISSAALSYPRPVGTFFIEKIPLPSWARKERLYFDSLGHQSNSILACYWQQIINGRYSEAEMAASRLFFEDLDKQVNHKVNIEKQGVLKGKLDSSRETILLALQPDEWLSWEGAIDFSFKPFDILGKCCTTFSNFNIVPTFHQDICGIQPSILSDLKLIYPNIVDLENEAVINGTEALLPVVDHVYAVSSASGLSALLYGKNLISDASSYLSGGAVTSNEFLRGKRSKLTSDGKINLAAFIIERYSKRIPELRTFDDYKTHGERIDFSAKKISKIDNIHRGNKNKFYGMTFGVLKFSYKNFTHFERLLETAGEYSVNLGDYVQSIAVRDALLAIGIDNSQIVYLDRDDLIGYEGPNVFLIMNAVFLPSSFPLPDSITPVYFGFSYHPKNIFPWNTPLEYEKSLIWLKSKGAIGCRDKATAEELASRGCRTYVSGCLSQAFSENKSNRCNLPTLKCGVDDNKFVMNLTKDFAKNEEHSFIFMPHQRRAVFEYPLSDDVMTECREAARLLIDFYACHVSLVVTSLMHCASPCAALGIPTVVARRDPENLRFSALRNLLPVISSGTSYGYSDLKSMARTINNRDHMLAALERAILESLV